MNKNIVFASTVYVLVTCQCLAGPLFGGDKRNTINKEMVMEHDVVLDEFNLLPFLTSILHQAGFVEQKPNHKVKQNSGVVGNNVTEAIYNFDFPEQTFKAVYKAIADCRRLRHSVKEIKPILSFLILGGHREAKLLAKKFSTKLPIKKCRAILTIYCLPSTYFNRRAPRARRLKRILYD